MEKFCHKPVLLKETIDALNVQPGGRYLDGTLGRAGHSREIARRGGLVLGLDRDDEAISEVTAERETDELLKAITIVKAEHGDLAECARAQGWDSLDGVLLDLGVSSPQLDEAARGFSFLREGPLDMRMDRTRGRTAADWVNEESVESLTEIFRQWGEEKQAYRIARAIEAARQKAPLTTTSELANLVEKTIGRHGGHHPATRVFQALRMAVNGEVDQLKRALTGAIELIVEGGRVAVITFESITDRIVKQFFAAHVGQEVSLLAGGSRWEGELPRGFLPFRKPITASDEELLSNPRSRSAKLRVFQKRSHQQ